LEIMMFFLFIYIIFVILFGLGLSESNVYDDHYFTEILVLFHAIAFGNMAMLYVITVYPLRKADTFAKDFQRGAKSKRSNKHFRLEQILRLQIGYDAFIQHLSSEFCMENLLSLTEFLQWKLYIHRKSQLPMDKDLRYWFTMLPLDALPGSEIVFAGEPRRQRPRKSRRVNRPKSPKSPRSGANTMQKMMKQISLSHSVDESAEVEMTEMTSPTSVTSAVSRTETDVSDVVMPRSPSSTLTASPRSPSSPKSEDALVVGMPMVKMRAKAHGLFVKYIAVGSEFEVNISHELRMRFRVLMEDKERWIENDEFDDWAKLRDIFDPICVVMRQLMNHSFTRFTHSRFFEKVRQEIDHE